MDLCFYTFSLLKQDGFLEEGPFLHPGIARIELLERDQWLQDPQVV